MYKNNFLNKIKKNWLLLLVGVFILFLVVFTFKDYGISWDEKDQMALGDTGLKYYISFGRDQSYFNLFSNQIEVLSTRGPIIEIIRSFFSVLFNKHSINFYHLFIALFALPTFYFIYKTIFLITENKFISNISPLFLLFMPRFFGDIYNNSKDILVGLFISIIIFLSLYIYKNLFTIRWYLFVLFGLVFGIGCSLRPVIIYILPLFIIYYLFLVLKNKINIKSINLFIRNIILLIISFVLNLHIFLPYLQLRPIVGMLDMLIDSNKFTWYGKMLFDGKFILSTELPWYYLPKWILITTPLFMVILFVVSMILFLIKFKQLNKFKLISISFIFFSFWLPMVSYFILKPVIYDAWRHFLFLSIPITLMSVLGLYLLIEFFKKNQTLTFLIYLFVVFGFLATGISYIKLHPYEYSYFNSLVGGLPGAYGKYETDYWGKSYKEAIDWLNINTPDYKTIYVKSCGHSFSSTYYMKKNLVFTGKFEEADYFVCYTRNFEHLSIDNSKTVHIIEREGVPLNYIKKLK